MGHAAQASAGLAGQLGTMTRAVSTASAGAQAYSIAGNQFIQSLERQAAAAGKTQSQLLELRAAELGVSQQASPYIQALRAQETQLARSGTQLNKYGVSAAQTAAAMRGVPAQLTDIVVSLQGGQAPLTVLLQQGGQLKDMFGGIRPAAAALAQTVLGMINPWVLAGAAIGAVAYAAHQGSVEIERLNRLVQLSGNYAGTSAAGIQQMAARVAGADGSRSAAQSMIEGLVGDGRLSAQTIETLAGTMQQFAKVSGQSSDDVLKDFRGMADGVLKWAEDHNKSMHFMDLATWERIRTLEEAGQREAAIQVLSQSLHEHLGTKAAAQVGTLERAWRGLTGAIQTAWSAMKEWGVESDPRVSAVQALEKQVRERQAIVDTVAASGGTVSENERSRLSALRARAEDLRTQLALEEAAAQGGGINAAARDAAVEAAAKLHQLDLQTSKTKQLNKALEENRRLEAAIRVESPNSDLVTPEAIRDREAATRKKFEDRDAAGAGQNALGGQLATLQQAAKQREEALKIEYATLERLRSIGYFSEVELIQRRGEAQRAALSDELAIAKRQEELAGGRKQLAERERYAGRVKEIQAEIVRSQEQEAAAIEKYGSQIRDVWMATRLDLENYQETRGLQASRSLNALTMGGDQRSLVDALNQATDQYRRVRDRYTERVRRIGGDGALGSDEYKEGVAGIDAAMEVSLEREREYARRRVEIQGDWRNGASRALADWQDDTANVMGQTQRIFTNAFGGFSDALTEMITNGKVNFRGLATSIIADIARMQARAATSQLFGFAMRAVGLVAGGAGATAGADMPGIGGTGGGLLDGIQFAKGGVSDSPDLSRYSNGVYNSPKFFAFAAGAGVFAEAGPEAIMPLKRGPDGVLGVRALEPKWAAPSQVAAAPKVTVHNYGGSEVNVRQMSDGELLLEVDRKLANGVPRIMDAELRRSNSRGHKAMTETFNVSPRR
ncbi:putative phage tail protein [Bordetella ansorpii]|uniref:Putative phage tail protein n=2 Tax=Bordetella ansorpii TaxID=288768 RepID=A0A157RLP1_9BORD|nr:putative phage tail protein [Bordetella ansorpii]